MAGHQRALRVLALGLLVAALVIAEDDQASGASIDPASVAPKIPGMTIIKEKLYEAVTSEHYQWALTLATLPCAILALVDGRRFFQVLVSILIGVVTAAFMVTQLDATWTTKTAKQLKYIAAIEVGAFIGWAAYEGWRGTQLLLGFLLGHYLYNGFEIGAHATPGVKQLAGHSMWHLCVGTLMVLLATWMLNTTHPRGGGGKVLSLVCPIFGGAFFVACVAYASVFALSLPGIARNEHAGGPIGPSQVPPLADFLLMMLAPVTSKPVGWFTLQGKTGHAGGKEFNIDQAVCIVAWFVISLFSICCQINRVDETAAAAREATNELKLPLVNNLDEDGQHCE